MCSRIAMPFSLVGWKAPPSLPPGFVGRAVGNSFQHGWSSSPFLSVIPLHHISTRCSQLSSCLGGKGKLGITWKKWSGSWAPPQGPNRYTVKLFRCWYLQADYWAAEASQRHLLNSVFKCNRSIISFALLKPIFSWLGHPNHCSIRYCYCLDNYINGICQYKIYIIDLFFIIWVLWGTK